MNNITYYFSDIFIAIQLNESILILHTEPTLDNIQIILGGIKFYANYNEANSLFFDETMHLNKKFYEMRDKLENDITFMSEFNKYFGEIINNCLEKAKK